MVGLIDKLNLPQLQEVGVAFSTGGWRAEILRFALDLPSPVGTLALEGQKVDNEFLSRTCTSPPREAQIKLCTMVQSTYVESGCTQTGMHTVA
jgi:hypothetical protein